MEDCIFCKIASGEITSLKIYEDEGFMAFLDVNPRTKGHTLVIPKKHYRWTYDVPNFGEFFEVAKKIELAAIKGLNAKWVTVGTVGKDVSHAHIHVVPRFSDVENGETKEEINKKFTEGEMKEI